MSNFNHERYMMAAAVIRMSRVIVEECLKWCNQRVVFKKPLIEQPAIRQKYVSTPLTYCVTIINTIRTDLPK